MKTKKVLFDVRTFVWNLYLYKTNNAKYKNPIMDIENQDLEDWSHALDKLVNPSDKLYIDEVNAFLKMASQHDLTQECIYSAMEALKEDPSLSISQALDIGLDEWIK